MQIQLTIRSEGDTTAGNVPIRIYTPISSGAKPKDLPLGIYTHGGGFIAGNLDAEDPICRAVAHHTPCIIVSVDYRLEPKHKMPTMIEDSVAATKWAHENAASLGADPDKIFTIGGSAGGGLALMIANECAKKGEDTVKGIVAIVPVALHPKTVPEKYKSMYTAYKENAKGCRLSMGSRWRCSKRRLAWTQRIQITMSGCRSIWRSFRRRMWRFVGRIR